MKRKLKFYEHRLQRIVESGEATEPGRLEGMLVDRIRKGEFDNHSCKKGRKRNYNKFFEKNLLQDFLIKQPTNSATTLIPPLTRAALGGEQEGPTSELNWKISVEGEEEGISEPERTPAQLLKQSSFESLVDTRPQNNHSATNALGLSKRINSFCSNLKHDLEDSAKPSPHIEKFFCHRTSETSIGRKNRRVDSCTTPLKCLLETSNLKLINTRSPEPKERFQCSIASLKMPWDMN